MHQEGELQWLPANGRRLQLAAWYLITSQRSFFLARNVYSVAPISIATAHVLMRTATQPAVTVWWQLDAAIRLHCSRPQLLRPRAVAIWIDAAFTAALQDRSSRGSVLSPSMQSGRYCNRRRRRRRRRGLWTSLHWGVHLSPPPYCRCSRCSCPISATLLHHFVPETLTAAGQWSNAVWSAADENNNTCHAWFTRNIYSCMHVPPSFSVFSEVRI